MKKETPSSEAVHFQQPHAIRLPATPLHMTKSQYPRHTFSKLSSIKLDSLAELWLWTTVDMT